MTYKVTVTYQIHDNSVMTKELTNVNKIETVYEMWNGEKVKLFKVHFGGYNGATWAASAILNVNMTPER